MHWQRAKRDYKLVKIAADPQKKNKIDEEKKTKKKSNQNQTTGQKLALALPLALL